MTKIVVKETRETITSWNSLDEVRAWAKANSFPVYQTVDPEERGHVLIVEASEFDSEEMGRVPVRCEFRVETFEDLGNGVLRSGGNP